MPSAAAPAALRKPDNSVPRDGGRGEVERRRRRRVINLGCSCVCGTPEAEACPAGHCVGQSPLISSCLFLALWLYKRVSHLITVVCDLTSHVYPPFSPPPAEPNLVTFHSTFPLSCFPCARPPETLSVAGGTLPVTHHFPTVF